MQNGTATVKSETEQLRELFKKDKPTRKAKKRKATAQITGFARIEPSKAEIEEWGRRAVTFGDDESQSALITLLHLIAESDRASSLALFARNAALARCDAIIDDVIRQAVATQLRRKPLEEFALPTL